MKNTPPCAPRAQGRCTTCTSRAIPCAPGASVQPDLCTTCTSRGHFSTPACAPRAHLISIYQAAFDFQLAGSATSDVAPQKRRPKESAAVDDLAEALRLTLRTPGWNNRTSQPMCVPLRGGCSLVVIPAHLWRPRIGAPVRTSQCEPIPFPRIGRRLTVYRGVG